jgi:N-acetylmuramoyl-L-alanine amidase
MFLNRNILRIFLISVFFVVTTLVNVSAQDFFEVEAQKGDGIFSLLRRYDLLKKSENISKFLSLNDIDKNSSLKIGKKYKLPVLIYKYNGKSIRSTLGIDDFDKALEIQHYNEFLLKNKLRKTSYRDSKILWVPYDKINPGKSTKNTASESKEVVKKNQENKIVKSLPKEVKIKKLDIKREGMNRYVPLFGKKWASVPIEDQSLAGRVFYILSGHGGPDPGAQCKKCNPVLCEDEYAYDVALRLARDLMQHGAIVHVIVQDKNDGIRDEKYLKCDRDEVTVNGLKIPLSQRKRLKQRSNDVNRLYSFYKKKRHVKSQTLVVIHVDSRHKDQRIDVFFSYAKGSKTGKRLAENILKTFDKKYSIFQKGRGYNGTTGPRNWFVLNNTYPPAVFIELANIKNPKDHKRLLIPSNRQALANWIFEGLRNTYK